MQVGMGRRCTAAEQVKSAEIRQAFTGSEWAGGIHEIIYFAFCAGRADAFREAAEWLENDDVGACSGLGGYSRRELADGLLIWANQKGGGG